MAQGLLNKLTNFLMPLEDETAEEQQTQTGQRPTVLRVHQQTGMRVYVAVPRGKDEEFRHLADCLISRISLVVNYEHLNAELQEKVHDFLCGVTYIIGGRLTRINEKIVMYVPANIDFDSCEAPLNKKAAR